MSRWEEVASASRCSLCRACAWAAAVDTGVCRAPSEWRPVAVAASYPRGGTLKKLEMEDEEEAPFGGSLRLRFLLGYSCSASSFPSRSVAPS